MAFILTSAVVLIMSDFKQHVEQQNNKEATRKITHTFANTWIQYTSVCGTWHTMAK